MLRSETDPRSSLRVALALGAGRPCLEDWGNSLSFRCFLQQLLIDMNHGPAWLVIHQDEAKWTIIVNHKFDSLLRLHRESHEWIHWDLNGNSHFEAALGPLQKQLQSSRPADHEQRTDLYPDTAGCRVPIQAQFAALGSRSCWTPESSFGKKKYQWSHGKSHFPFPGNATYHGWGTVRWGTRNVQGAPRHTFRKASNAIPTSWTRHERLPSKEGDHICPRLLTHAMPTTSEWLVLYFLSKHTETLSR